MNLRTRIFALMVFSFVTMVLLAVPIPAWAQVTVIQVSSGGDIQGAINQAAAIINGATPTDVLIEVDPGTYVPTVFFGFEVSGINNPLFTVTLQSEEGPGATILDASNVANNVIRGFGTRNFVVDGFTIRNRIADQTNFLGRGIFMRNATGIAVQHCHFDTTFVGAQFQITDPTFSSHASVVNNTGIAGQGTDVNAPGFVETQAASMQFSFPLGTSVTGESRLVAANNVFRCNGSCVRYIALALDPDGNIIGTFSNGSLVMNGNDVSSSLAGGFNILGGHAHVIAGNRIHDGDIGGFFQGAVSGVIENNVIFNNSEHGLFLSTVGPISQDFPGEDRVIRHNTIVNNSGTGIVYIDSIGTQTLLPNVYNNVIAFNDAGGVSSVVSTASTFAFIPVSFNLAKNDNYGNTLRNFGASFSNFNYIGISNPGAAAPNYSGVINTGQDLSVVPGFIAAQFEDFSLMPTSMLVNAGITSRPTPFQDFAGHLRDAQPDVGAFEVVSTPTLNVRNNPLRKGPKDQ
jgi:parallel beta helix pectate lyase-like protein